MADNVTITPGTGATIASDSVGGVQYQVVKLDVGGDGVSLPVSTSNPVPVVEGGAVLTALQVIDDLPVAQGSTTSGEKGVLVQGAVTTASPAYTTAQTSPLSLDASGSLRVAIISGAGSGGTAMTDDAAFTVGTTNVTPVAGTYKSVRDSVDDNDGGAFAMTIKRSQYVSIDTPLGDSAMDDTLDALKVSIVGDSVGSTVDADSNAVVVGNVAHDGADTRAPVKMGAKANANLSGLTLVAAADRTDLYAGLDGVLITRPYCNLEDIVVGNASNTDGASTEVIAAQAAGIRTYITSCSLINMHASTDAYVELKDGTTVMWRGVIPHASGLVTNFPCPLKGTAATAWNYDPSAAVTTTYCSLVGFKSKV